MFEAAADVHPCLKGLNPEQARAVTHSGGPLLVLAGAGTGKTRTLTARAEWLLGEGTAERLLLLTFTRRAADDMLGRLSSHAAVQARARAWGGTFHSVAHRLLRRHAESFALTPDFSVLDPGDVADVLDLLRPDHGLGGTGRRVPRAQACADIYSRCVNQQSPVSDVVAAAFPWCDEYREQLAALFRAYAAHKERHALVDFDDLLLLWNTALGDASLGPVLREHFDAVLVDEYQDVNAVQAEIVRRLQPHGEGLTCVGDPAQAIYAFRGANPAHILALPDGYPSLTVVTLSRSYRSRDPILRVANVVRPHREGFPITLDGCRGGGTTVTLHRCHDEATQARQVCERVLASVECGRELRDHAVLVRSAHHSAVLELELSARRIPFVKYGGLRFTEAAHVKDFVAAARVCANPADDVAWFRVLRLHEGVGSAVARRIIDVLRPEELDPMQRWPDALESAPAASRPGLCATIEGLASAARVDSAAARAGAVLRALVVPLTERYSDADLRVADLERLVDAAAAHPSLHDAIVELTLDPPRSAGDLAGPPALDEDYVTISTIHSAKGLEWPVVHLLHLVDGAVPSDMALSTAEGLAEEHRLFYVAVTRARDELLLYAPHRLHHHRTAHDDAHSYGRLSRFLDTEALAACEVVSVAPSREAGWDAALPAHSVATTLEPLWR